MTLPEAIVYLLASSNQGMKTDQIAREINERGLYQRWDKEPVSEKQIWAVVLSHPETFVKSDGRIRLMISKYSVFMTQGPSAHGHLGRGDRII